MTLLELKDAIDDMVEFVGDDKADGLEVMTEYDYGNYTHTRALVDFTDVQLIMPKKTAYSCSGLGISEHNSDELAKNQVVALITE